MAKQKPKPATFKPQPARKASFMVLNLTGSSEPIVVEGSFRNVFPTLEEAIEHAATAVAKPNAKVKRLHVAQIMHVVVPSKGSHQADGISDAA